MRLRPALLLPALLLLAHPAAAQAPLGRPSPVQPAPGPSLHVTGSGEFTATRDLGPRDPAATDPAATDRAVDTVTMVENPRIVRRTSRIEAQLCRRFGFMFTMEGMPPGGVLSLTVQSVHPPILYPGGQVSTGMTYDMSVSGDEPGLVGFSFDDPWELVPGTWTFTVRLGGRILTEQAYDVTASPDPAPLTRVDCSAAVS